MISNKRSRKILAHCNQYHYITDSKLEIDKELNIISLHKGHGCAFPPSPPTSKSVCTCYFCQLKHHCIILSSAHFRHLGHDANRKSYELHTLVQTYKRAPNICKTLVSSLLMWCFFFVQQMQPINSLSNQEEMYFLWKYIFEYFFYNNDHAPEILQILVLLDCHVNKDHTR